MISSSHSHKVNQNTVQGTSVEEHLKGLDTQELDPSGGTPDTKISHEGPDLPTASLGGEQCSIITFQLGVGIKIL